MFTERFNELFSQLKIATDLEFSRYVQCERSYVNRLRSGSRIPKPDGKMAEMVVTGFYSYAREKHMIRVLCRLISSSVRGSQEEIEEDIKKYLYEGYIVKNQAQKDEEVYNRKLAYKINYKMNFVKRFKEVMDIIGISNARLARLVNVDASVISRYRSGTTVPKKDSDIAGLICRKLLQCMQLGGYTEEISQYTGIDKEILEDEGMGQLTFKNWLFDAGDYGALTIKKFIDNVSDLEPAFNFPLLPVEECAGQEPVCVDKKIYLEDEGLREAVLRLLHMALEQKAEELWLYSDCRTEWMSRDKVFARKWSSMMSHCLQAGIHIRIIHNIDRGVQEMTEAIRMWTPLYLSGQIESYYNVKPCGSRFAHTIFIARGIAGVCGWNPKNQKEGAVYSYITNEEMLHHAEGMFSELLKNSRHLIKVNVGESDFIERETDLSEPMYEDNKTKEIHSEKEVDKKENRLETVVITKQVKISVSDKCVMVSRTEEPHLEFMIRHPLMVMAFQEYIRM